MPIDLRYRLFVGTPIFSSKHRQNHLVQQRKITGHRSHAIGGDLIPATADFDHNGFAPEFLQIVCCLTSRIRFLVNAQDFPNLLGKHGCRHATGCNRKHNERFHHRPLPRIIDVNAGRFACTHNAGLAPCLNSLRIKAGNIDTLQLAHELIKDCGKTVDYFRKILQTSFATKLGSIMYDNLDSQYASAFAIHLHGESAEMDFEHRQIIDRFLDHDFDPRQFTMPVTVVGTVFMAKDGLERTNIKCNACALNDAIKHMIQNLSAREQQVPAQFRLKYRIRISDARFFLFGTLQGKTQAARVYPTLADIGQSPYRAGSSHGVCDGGQCWSVGNSSKAVVFFSKWNFALSRLTFNVFMTIENNHCIERRMGTEADNNMPPHRINNMKRINIDMRPVLLLPNLGYMTVGTLYLHYRCRRSIHQNAEQTSEGSIPGHMSGNGILLFFPGIKVLNVDFVFCRIRPDSSTEMSGKSHQVGIVQVVIIAIKQTPPLPKPSAALQQRNIGIEHKPVDAIIRAVKKLRIILAERIIVHSIFPWFFAACWFLAIPCAKMKMRLCCKDFNPYQGRPRYA